MPKALVRKRCFVQMTGYEPVGRGTPASPLHPRNGAVPESLERARQRLAAAICPPTARWQAGPSTPGDRTGGSPRTFTGSAGTISWPPTWPRSDWWRFPLGIAALLEFILTGTAIRYFIVAWRYGGFFLYPFALHRSA